VDELETRLSRCFSLIFPSLTEEEIRESDVARLIDVDSLAAVTLVALIHEQFAVNLDMDDLQSLGSFRAVWQYVHEKALPGMCRDDQRTK
jgi:acyl carrier protein